MVKNYIRLLDLTNLGLSTDLPAGTGVYQSPLEDFYVSINAVFDAAEEEDSILIGFVDQYTVVTEIDKEVDNPEGILMELEDVFSQREFPDPPPHRAGVDLSIDLVEGKSAPFGPIYSLSVQEEVVLKKFLDGALSAGIIRESKSSAAAPVMFMKKSDGSLRLCVDYRGL